MLTLAIFFPLVGAALIATLPKHQEQQAKYVAAMTSAFVFAVVCFMFLDYDRGKGGYQYIDSVVWLDSHVSSFKLHYAVGVDGLSLPLIALNAFLTLISVLISFKVELRPKEYFAWLMILETSLMGVFSSLDFVLFFLFWEVELIPMYFLISIWGSGNRVYSAWKYVLYTFFGSAFMIVGILTLGFTAGTFDIRELSNIGEIHGAIVPAWVIFSLIIIAFLIKLPVVPFHTWLPDAHTDAPTAVSVILAGVLLKMGGYGILRLAFNIMPDVAHDARDYLAVLAAVSIIYGALMTLMQRDLKRLIAYSSVSHMGYVLLGASSIGLVGFTGAATQLVTHGLITGMLFVLVGMVYDRAHTRDIGELSGLAHRMPFITVMMLVAGLASLGLPALAGFVAEVMIFLGSFDSQKIPTVVAVLGVAFAAGYILWTVQRVFWGEPNPKWAELTDATQWWERGPLLAMALSIVAIGVYPAWVVDLLRDGVTPIAGRFG
ncbi:MAG TPA: NADH-quinone oxidoreductase subunit M [Dehalococcoidia bacterium]|jgi:NADH-quinone oxidoreductase subunit M|nr:NADH-quinone oxidoreductase subunit M [Dehalococcoidia bacterium]